LKKIRRHVTYANVMSSLAVFMILGGATAFAAVKKVGPNEIKANSIKTGKIVKEAVAAGKIKNGAVIESKIGDGAVTTNKLADNAVTTPKIANDAVTGEKVNESTLGEVPTAGNALKLDGKTASSFASSAGGIKAAFTFNDGSIELPFNALNGGAFSVLEDNASLTKIAAPFSVEDRVAVVSGSSINATGGQSAPFPRCIYTVQNLSATTFQVNHVNADAAGGCEEEWSILIF
jgi:hypothetical protein